MSTPLLDATLTRPRNAVGVEQLHSARRRAQRLRAEWLTSVHEGFMSVPDLIGYAATDDGAPLRRIRLRDLLLSQNRWGEVRADAVLSSLCLVLDLGEGPFVRRLTVGWLLDNRTRGKRFDALLDVLAAASGHGRQAPPWTQFPFTTASKARP